MLLLFTAPADLQVAVSGVALAVHSSALATVAAVDAGGTQAQASSGGMAAERWMSL